MKVQGAAGGHAVHGAVNEASIKVSCRARFDDNDVYDGIRIITNVGAVFRRGSSHHLADVFIYVKDADIYRDISYIFYIMRGNVTPDGQHTYMTSACDACIYGAESINETSSGSARSAYSKIFS